MLSLEYISPIHGEHNNWHQTGGRSINVYKARPGSDGLNSRVVYETKRIQ